MPRPAATSIEEVVRKAIEDVVARAARSIASAVAEMTAAELQEQLSVAKRPGRGPARRPARRPPRQEITKWVADNRARRVPNFVIELTGGLDTKKKIVARYGENVVFEKGKPAPKPAKAA